MPCRIVGNAIICGRGQTRCSYCDRPSSRLCDAEVKPGKTCDTPMCEMHSWSPEPGKDYCRHHRMVIEEPKIKEKLKAEREAKKRSTLVFIAKSKYAGSCKDKDCGARWDAGDQMYWDSETRESFCAECGEQMQA